MRTDIGQESSHQLVILVTSLVHMRVEYVSLVYHWAGPVAKVRPGVLVLEKEKRGTCSCIGLYVMPDQKLVEHVRFTLTLSNSAT